MRHLLRNVQILIVVLVSTNPLIAQNGNGGGAGGGGGGIGNGGGQQNVGGIIIDGEGIVKTSPRRRISSSRLEKLQEEFAEQNLNSEIIEQSESRVVSLKQIDKAVKEALEAGTPIPITIEYLAGLQRIDFVRIDYEKKDILIVGPAEGFGPGADERVVGVTTGRPPLKLDDLVVALRSTMAGQQEIGVSIDPTNENMAKLQNYVRNNSGVSSTAGAKRRLNAMAGILGNQVISLWGVPEQTHFALALVEADLRMKRIALGLDKSKVRNVPSHLALLQPNGNSLQRWWFMPLYEPIGTNEDRTLFEIRGQRAQLMAQEEISDAQGERTDSAFTRQSTQRFAKLFTENFEELANRNPAFAELQNLYDLSLMAALAKENWPFENRRDGLNTLLDDERLPVNSYVVPKFVRSDSVTKKSGKFLLGLVGGVTINVNRMAREPEMNLSVTADKFDTPAESTSWWWQPESTVESE